jgi:hypothetical protein
MVNEENIDSETKLDVPITSLDDTTTTSILGDTTKADIQPHLYLVPDYPSSKNIPEVSSPTTSPNSHDIDTTIGYTLPFKHNLRKPPNRYSLEFE